MRALGLLLAAVALAGCGKSSGKVLEKIQDDVVAEDRPRMDVFIPRVTESCAAGNPCTSADQSRCFTLTDASGNVLSFDPASVDFLPPGNSQLQGAPLSGCFKLVVDPPMRTRIAQAFNHLDERINALSGRRIDLDIRLHDLDTVSAGFKRWEGGTGIFLQPAAIETSGLSLVGPDMDFAFAITGDADLSAGYAPKIAVCGGSNWEAQGGFGGSAYTWLSASCVDESDLLFHFMTQSYFDARDVMSLTAYTERNYPACGRAAADPSTWFPGTGDCSTDPDSPTCGDPSCSFYDDDYLAHVLAEHWPTKFIGNHCRNGVMDYGETAVDTGGICARLGR